MRILRGDVDAEITEKMGQKKGRIFRHSEPHLQGATLANPAIAPFLPTPPPSPLAQSSPLNCKVFACRETTKSNSLFESMFIRSAIYWVFCSCGALFAASAVNTAGGIAGPDLAIAAPRHILDFGTRDLMLTLGILAVAFTYRRAFMNLRAKA